MDTMDTSDGPRRGSGRGRGRSNYWGSNRSNYQQSDNRGFQGSNQSRNFRGSSRGPSRGGGRGSRGRGFGGGRYSFYRGQPHLPEDVQELGKLGHVEGGHAEEIKALAWDHERNQLYSGSKDGNVCVWNCDTAQCEKKVDQGGEVDSLLIEGGYLFVGLHTKQNEGLIKTYNMTTGQQDTLVGHQGDVYCLHIAMNMLFSGGRDCSLRVWTFDANSQQFVLQAEVGASMGGHSSPVTCIASVGSFLYTGDQTGNIKVWDLGGGACTQTIAGAHENVISQMISWQNPEGKEFLISCSFDGSVRVWQHREPPMPGAVLDPAPLYVHPDDQDQGAHGRGKPRRLPQILDMMGQLDTSANPVLVTSHSEGSVAHLWDLPSFEDRGLLPRAINVRAVCSGPAGLMFSGDARGLIRVFQFKGAP
mmetsp:Transcript_447/g.967  ORF Transcript_447/g.967 Transcript_447/m.967 type:complete len:418 (+) Transcript_447:252-1505(+)